MRVYFAPLEGLTDAIYRRVHHATFGGVEKYFMPFVSPSSSLAFTSRQQADIDPRENAGVPAVPQILCRDAALFLEMTKLLQDAGYSEVNLNLGCPSGTVTAKGKGAGMLKDPDALARFLDAIYAKSPLPVSLKTRCGYDTIDEWPRLLRIILCYPVYEWILHPRTYREFYNGSPHRDFFLEAAEKAPFPVIYNGDLFRVNECREMSRFDLMLGRGLAVNPALAQEARGGEGLTVEALALFHDRLYREYLKWWPEHAVVGRMHGVMYYLMQALECPAPVKRALRKSASADEYAEASYRAFAESELAQDIHFTPPSHTAQSRLNWGNRTELSDRRHDNV